MIVPSRGRPQAALELALAFQATATGDTSLVFAVDQDDPTEGLYDEASHRTIKVQAEPGTSSMGRALHVMATHFAFSDEPPFAIGFMGDDHRPRTHGWDKAYLDALHELGTGIVYGNDLLQGENIPTQVAMTSDIIRALGYMAPPSLTHLYFDNFWKVLGNGANCLRYLPDVIVEHMHPVAGKAEWDEGYVRVNSQAMYEKDSQAFAEWLKRSMVEDVAKVRGIR